MYLPGMFLCDFLHLLQAKSKGVIKFDPKHLQEQQYLRLNLICQR